MVDPANRLVIALAQISSIVGDIAGNRDRLRKARAEAAAFGADLVTGAGTFPRRLSARGPGAEAGVPGGLPRRLRGSRARDGRRRTRRAGRPALGRGRQALQRHGAADGGRIEAVRFKVDLPNYGVFDEKRVFAPGPSPGPIVFRGVRIGVPICEDIWGPDPVECILETGGEILLVPNASPYERDKLAIRESVAVARVVESGLPLIYLNQVGGQDELVFEGASFALNADRTLAVQLPAFRPNGRAHGLGARRRRLALRRGPARDRRGGRRGRLCGLRDGPARLCREQPLSRRRARPLGRRRFGALRGDGGRRAWARRASTR